MFCWIDPIIHEGVTFLHIYMRAPSAQPPVVTPPRSLAVAVRRLLRPLIRMMLHYSVQYPYLANLLKLTYVEVATHMPVPGKEQTDSRVSMLTGIHRLDVKRLRSEIVTDIRPRVVLDEWLRLGIARVDEQDRVVLITDAFVPSHGLDEKLFYLGKNVHDHLGACAHNLTQQDAPPLLERSVYFDQLSEQSADMLASYARQLSSQAIQAFGQKAMELQEKDSKSSSAKYRVTYGLYFYHSDENSESTPK
jgi:hypothetical protein